MEDGDSLNGIFTDQIFLVEFCRIQLRDDNLFELAVSLPPASTDLNAWHFGQYHGAAAFTGLGLRL